MRLRQILTGHATPLRAALAAAAIGCAVSTLTAEATAAQAPPAQASAAKPAPAKAAQTKPVPATPAPATPASAKPGPAKPGAPAAQADAGPVVTMETAKGTIVFQLYAQDAPKSVAHIVKLIKSSFYRSQRVLRVVPGQLVQFGDKQSRDMTRREWWGRGVDSGSGQPIGVSEMSKTRKFKLGTVGLAHSGDPRQADSQMFFALRTIPEWNGKYVIIGQVTAGLDVLPKLKVEDLIKLVTVADAK